MSRLASKPVAFPAGVSCVVDGSRVSLAKSGKTLFVPLNPSYITVTIKDSSALFQERDDVKIPANLRGLLGTTWALFRVALKNLESGHRAKLNLVGVGYKASVVKFGSFSYLKIVVGFSHPIFMFIPSAISIAVEKDGIIVTGHTTEAVTTFCAKVRMQKKPTVYHGTGVIMNDEVIIKKVGKKK